MKRQLLVLVAMAALAVLLFPTAAVPFTGDADTEISDVTMEPSEGSNGVYAVIEDGEIRLDLSETQQVLAGDGINDNSVTDIDDVFTITYTGENDRPATVWLTHEGDREELAFYRDDDPDRLLIGSQNSVELGNNETVRVGLQVDTTGDHDVEAIETFTVHAERAAQDTPTETPPPPPPETPTPTPTPTPTETPTATPIETPTATPIETPTETPTQTSSDASTPETPTPTPTDAPPTPTPTPTDAPPTPTPTPTDTPIDGEFTGVDGPDDEDEGTQVGLGEVFAGTLADTFLLLLLALIVGIALFLIIRSTRDEEEE